MTFFTAYESQIISKYMNCRYMITHGFGPYPDGRTVGALCGVAMTLRVLFNGCFSLTPLPLVVHCSVTICRSLAYKWLVKLYCKGIKAEEDVFQSRSFWPWCHCAIDSSFISPAILRSRRVVIRHRLSS
jgi:hypothetical protein